VFFGFPSAHHITAPLSGLYHAIVTIGFYSAIETVFRPAERRLDARTQLARAEGLGYVILRAKFQVQNFFGFGGVLVALIGL